MYTSILPVPLYTLLPPQRMSSCPTCPAIQGDSKLNTVIPCWLDCKIIWKIEDKFINIFPLHFVTTCPSFRKLEKVWKQNPLLFPYQGTPPAEFPFSLEGAVNNQQWMTGFVSNYESRFCEKWWIFLKSIYWLTATPPYLPT